MRFKLIVEWIKINRTWSKGIFVIQRVCVPETRMKQILLTRPAPCTMQCTNRAISSMKDGMLPAVSLIEQHHFLAKRRVHGEVSLGDVFIYWQILEDIWFHNIRLRQRHVWVWARLMTIKFWQMTCWRVRVTPSLKLTVCPRSLSSRRMIWRRYIGRAFFHTIRFPPQLCLGWIGWTFW